ncbi:hypothetical protein KVR01_003207 [Diaporthe batatas]|uniref:uncharacterized protein n=1 Tax=Diaporthe batatas TaxID=748121 RepID=UPI001D03CE74|nr:uncharacterized protein KVR01_003207 [Diaporthe batatas]KAG8167518.1 hypothetical protein KVR01_003207 [Diaporthe batatas]
MGGSNIGVSVTGEIMMEFNCSNALIVGDNSGYWRPARYHGGNDRHTMALSLNLEATALTMFGKKLNHISAAESHPMLQGMEDSTAEAMKRPNRPGLLNRLSPALGRPRLPRLSRRLSPVSTCFAYLA